jgi:uncharacterized protein YbbK (DUF523 family)
MLREVIGMILVSGCLCGINCKYDGGNNLNERVLRLLEEGKAIPVCPEQLGGQETPRVPHEIIEGNGAMVLEGTARVKGTEENDDVTKEFITGALETLKIAKAVGAKIAILKARSPSCGKGIIYDGTFSGRKKHGNGVTTELLLKNNIKVYTEEELDLFFEENKL